MSFDTDSILVVEEATTVLSLAIRRFLGMRQKNSLTTNTP